LRIQALTTQMAIRALLSSFRFQVAAAFLGLTLMLAAAGLSVVGAFQRQLAYDAMVDRAARLELTAEQLHVQAMNYKQNAPRDYATYYRDVRLYYQDLMAQVATFDAVVDAFMTSEMAMASPGGGGAVHDAIRALEGVWSGYRRGLFDKIGEDPAEPRLEWAAEFAIAEHAGLAEATGALASTLRDWAAGEHRRLTRGAVLVALIALVVAVGLLAVLERKVLAPLGRTMAGFQRVAAGDFKHRLGVAGTSEIRDLTTRFNQLTIRLDLLHEMIARLQRGKDLDELIGFLADDFRGLLGFDWIGVVLIDSIGSVARLETCRLDGRPGLEGRRLFRLRGTLLEAALAGEGPRHVADMERQARDNPPYELLRHLVAQGMRDAIFLPLTPQSQAPTPAVVVLAARDPQRFDAPQRRFLGNIAQLLTHSFGRTARLAEQGRLAAIGEFASGIAHELRTPLTTVSLALEYLAEHPPDARAKRRADLGLQEANRMRRLLEDMLLYAKPLRLALAATDLAAALGDQVAAYREAHPDARVRLTTDLAGAEILADADRLQQVFLNLTDNACEAAPAGSEVVWTLSASPDGDRVLTSLHNQGEPIPPELLGRITEPFVSTKSGGAGLGLAIVRRLVEQQGGAIAIASSRAEGTRVTLSFPGLAPTLSDEADAAGT
jgi:signal transduction histidine kinase/HAMP domain-containing protein